MAQVCRWCYLLALHPPLAVTSGSRRFSHFVSHRLMSPTFHSFSRMIGYLGFDLCKLSLSWLPSVVEVKHKIWFLFHVFSKLRFERVCQGQWGNRRCNFFVGVLLQVIYVTLWSILKALLNIHEKKCCVVLHFLCCFTRVLLMLFVHNISWCLYLCWTDVYE
jgi:hypothetical protein